MLGPSVCSGSTICGMDCLLRYFTQLSAVLLCCYRLSRVALTVPIMHLLQWLSAVLLSARHLAGVMLWSRSLLAHSFREKLRLLDLAVSAADPAYCCCRCSSLLVLLLMLLLFGWLVLPRMQSVGGGRASPLDTPAGL